MTRVVTLHYGRVLTLLSWTVIRLVRPLGLTELTVLVRFTVCVLVTAVTLTVVRVLIMSVLLVMFPVSSVVTCTLLTRLRLPPSV